MDIKVIEKALRDYKRKKSVIETTLLRIEAFKEAMEDPESFREIFPIPKASLGMPKSDSVSSYVERTIIDKEEAIEVLKEWIKDDKSRIYPYQIEIEQIDAALLALTMQERFIIECKYLEGMFWNEIEINFNNKFRQKNYITDEGIRKINRQAINLLVDILSPYYSRFKVKK